MNISIELDGVSFSYGEKPVLREVSVSVAMGEFVCLLGPNGAGKTTLAQLIAGELSPTEGRVFLNRRRRICRSNKGGDGTSHICLRTFKILPL